MNYKNLIDQIVTTKQGREFFVEYVKINRKGVFVAELGNNQLVNVNDLVSPNAKIPQTASTRRRRTRQEEVNNEESTQKVEEE